jgi:hypothetical protein
MLKVMLMNMSALFLTIIFFCFCKQQVLYTLGGLENVQTAKKYYASTIELTGGKNTRALFGICLVSSLSLSLSLSHTHTHTSNTCIHLHAHTHVNCHLVSI